MAALDTTTRTALVVENDDLKNAQAELTRFQSVLGLRVQSSEDDIRNLHYGDDLERLDIDKPIGPGRSADVRIVSVDLEVERHRKLPTRVILEWHKIDVLTLKAVPPKELVSKIRSHAREASIAWKPQHDDKLLSEATLGKIRHRLARIFEPRCFDHSGDQVNSRDGNYNKHTEHKTCGDRKSILLLLNDKQKALENMRALGFDPSRHLHIIEIMDVRVMNWICLFRNICKLYNPWTNRQPSVIAMAPDLPTIEEVWERVECPPPRSGPRPRRSLASFQAAITMAVDHASSPGWLRSREQVNGGQHPGGRTLDSRDDIVCFLSEYDFAMKGPVCKAEIETAIASLKARPPVFDDAQVVKMAQENNYANLIPTDVLKKAQQALVERSVLERTKIVSSTTMAAHSDNASTLPKTPKPNDVTFVSASSPLALGATLPSELGELVGTYQEAGQTFLKWLLNEADFQKGEQDETGRVTKLSVGMGTSTWNVKIRYDPHEPRNKPAIEVPYIFSESYLVLTKSLRVSVPKHVAESLNVCISGREKVYEWHQRLPENDSRYPDNAKHKHHINTLQKARDTLIDKGLFTRSE